MITHSSILYDAGGLLVVDKPEGVLSHPNPVRQNPKRRDSPLGAVRGNRESPKQARCAFEGAYDFEKRVFETPEGPVWLIHRLDQDTSGALMAARTSAMAQKCRMLFEKGGIRKYYTALAAGRIEPPKGSWNDTLVVQRQGNKVRSRMITSPHPNARLQYERLRYFPEAGLSLIRMELITGKTHQIRVQSAGRRHPIAGDEIYGNFSLNKELRKKFQIRRLFLHASALEIEDPSAQKGLRIEAPLPEKLSRVLEVLR